MPELIKTLKKRNKKSKVLFRLLRFRFKIALVSCPKKHFLLVIESHFLFFFTNKKIQIVECEKIFITSHK